MCVCTVTSWYLTQTGGNILANLFSAITVILLINMPIPKFDSSCKIFATNLNAANLLRTKYSIGKTQRKNIMF